MAAGRGCDGVTPVSLADGPRHVVILHETEHNSVPFGVMVNNLRTGQNKAYLDLKEHRLDIVDDLDDGSPPPPLIAQLEQKGIPEPAVYVLDGDDDPVLYAAPLPPAASAADVMAILKSHGG